VFSSIDMQLVGLSFAIPHIRHCADAPVVFFHWQRVLNYHKF